MKKETIEKIEKEIEKEISNIDDFMSASENEDFNFSLSAAQERKEQLEKLLKTLCLKIN